MEQMSLNPRSGLPPLVRGPWLLSDLANGTLGKPKHGLTVFSCFHCGGGSTMGYKLAGFDVLGGVEIDPEMMNIYRRNHAPKLSYLMGVQEFKALPEGELSPELFKLDVLDGSPPCSSFSMAGARERDWGKEKVFREGQAEQRLDDLFFHFIDIASRLRPKVVISENVKGLILGNARGYVKEIFHAFESAGYETQLFLLNSARMGVPQVRERTFFLSRRRDLGIPPFSLGFDEVQVSLRQAIGDMPKEGRPLPPESGKWWSLTPNGKSFSTVHPKGNWFGHVRPSYNLPHPTIVAGTQVYHPLWPRYLSNAEVVRVQSFPDDFEFLGTEARYVCGMSVPPLMMQRVAIEVGRSLLGSSIS